MPFTINEIADTLFSSAKGKILAFNMVHAVIFGVLSKAKASEFILDWWRQYLSGDDDELSLDNLENTFYAVLWEGEESSKIYLSATQITRTTTNKEHGLFYSVKEYDSLYKYPLNGYVFDNGEVLPSPDSIDLETEIEHMKKVNIFDGQFKLPSGQRFSQEHGVYWVCPEKDLDDVFAGADIATRARDFLGLADIGSDSFIMAVKLEPKYMENLKGKNAAVRPTPLDAGFHSRFKCVADKSFRKIYDHESGYTFDLEKQSKKEINADGGREFIVKENHAIPVSSLILVPIGKTTSSVDSSNLAEIDFIKRLERIGGISETGLATEFKALI